MESAKQFVEDSAIISMHPTVAYMRFGNSNAGEANIYSTRGCRKNCEICGAYLYRHHSIIQALDEKVLEQITYLHDLNIQKFKICDEDIFSCSYSRIERLLYLAHQAFPDITFGINFLITNQTTESQINRINTFYNYGLKNVTYYFCQETEVEKTLTQFKKMLKKQNDQIETKVVIYLGKYKESEKYYKDLMQLMKNKKEIMWDIRFEIPEVIEGIIPDVQNYKIWTDDIKLYNFKNPVMVHQAKYEKSAFRGKRIMMLEVYGIASRKNNILNPAISESVQEGFRDFSMSYNGSEIDVSELGDLI